MSEGHIATVISPSTFEGGGERGNYPVELFDRKFLAQGDSWFSIGSFPPGRTTNILMAPLVLEKSTLIVSCARPGKVLHHMGETTRDPAFVRLLTGNLSTKWDAILISGGGNDLIDAAGVTPQHPVDKRMLLTPAERGAGSLSPQGYLSEAGWLTFSTYVGAVFNQFVDLRDSGQNRRVPTFLHNYASIMPRPSPAAPGFGPWLYSALVAYQVPLEDRLAVTSALLDRLSTLLGDLIQKRTQADPQCALHRVDTLATANLALAAADVTGPSGDFTNEIHPSRDGYRKVAKVWGTELDATL